MYFTASLILGAINVCGALCTYHKVNKSWHYLVFLSNFSTFLAFSNKTKGSNFWFSKILGDINFSACQHNWIELIASFLFIHIWCQLSVILLCLKIKKITFPISILYVYVWPLYTQENFIQKKLFSKLLSSLNGETRKSLAMWLIRL